MGENSPFEYIKLLNNKGEIPDDSELKLNYVPFITNRNLASTLDTVLFANEMNKHHELDKADQFKYYFYSINKRKRYSKWIKPIKLSNDFLIVKKYYDYNNRNTEVAMKLLTKEQLKIIKEKMNIGGSKRVEYDI